MPIWILAILIPFVFVIGIIIGFVITRTMIKKMLEKNPPINEDVIRTLYQQIGRKPSERQIQNMLISLKNKNTRAATTSNSQKNTNFTQRFQASKKMT